MIRITTGAKRMYGIATLVCALVMFAGGARAQKIDVEFDHGVDFAKYRTYAWRQGKIKSKSAALDNSIVDRNLHAAIDAHMMAKGFRLTEGNPDVDVTYVLGAQRQNRVEYAPGPRWNGGVRQRIRKYTRGTLTIDLIDASSTQLVWRAIVDDSRNNPADFEKHLDKDVKKAFDKYPPKK